MYQRCRSGSPIIGEPDSSGCDAPALTAASPLQAGMPMRHLEGDEGSPEPGPTRRGTPMTRRSFTVAFLISSIAAALLAPAAADATVGQSNWSQNGAGPARHAANAAETQLDSSTVGQLTLVAGGFANDCHCTMRPIISDGVVYSQVLDVGGARINAWDEQTGAFLWATQVYSPINNFAVSDGVIVASENFFANLYGFSTADGSLIWTAAAGNSDVQPVIANGVVYVDHGFVQALDLHTGAILWNGPNVNGTGLSGLTVGVNGSEVFQYAGGSLFAFDTADGHQLWSTACAIPGRNAGDRSPMVLRGVVYDGAGCAIDAITGTAIWNISANRLSLTNDATGGSRVFAGYEWGTSSGQVYDRMAALDRKTGHVLWYHDVPSDFHSDGLGEGPIVANGLVYFTDRNFGQTTIKAYDAKTGKRVWKSQPVSHVYGISIADGRIWADFFDDDLIRYWSLP
jgi:outer membrane protein assembly factor BamB